MKKIVSKILVVMMLLVMTFSLAACGSEADDKKDNATSGTSQSQDKDNSTDDDADDSTDDTSDTDDISDNDDASDNSDSSSFSTLSDYVNSDEVKEMTETLSKSLEGSGMSIDISADGDKMIYTYTYDKLEKTDEMTKQLEESIKAQDQTFQTTANNLKNYVDSDTVTVVIKYVDCNGEEIFSKEYVSE